MTKTIANITLGTGGSAVTVYVTQCEKVMKKTIVAVTPGQSTANKSLGPKSTKIVDLQRIETRFVVSGYIDGADESKFEALMTGGGVFNLTWKLVDYNVNFEQFSIKEGGKAGEQDETDITFTALVGVNI